MPRCSGRNAAVRAGRAAVDRPELDCAQSPLCANSHSSRSANRRRTAHRGRSEVPHIRGRSGKIWTGDAYYSSCEIVSTPDLNILRTLDPTLYQQATLGDFRYDIPLKPRIYKLHLHFVELLLHLQFSPSVGKALLSGTEILPGTAHYMRPVRVVARFRGHYCNGALWQVDRLSQGGTGIMRSVAVSGTNEPGIYAGERFGYFSYFIPVADGRYSVTLRFAESIFGLEHPINAAFSPGSGCSMSFAKALPWFASWMSLKKPGVRTRLWKRNL